MSDELDRDFVVEILSDDMMSWIRCPEKTWDGNRWRFHSKTFPFLETALAHGRSLSKCYRVVELTYHYGDFVMAKQVIKMLDGSGFQVKGVKGVDPKKSFKNGADFATEYKDIEKLNAIGKGLLGKEYAEQQDTKIAAKLCWDAISTLPVSDQVIKERKVPDRPVKSYEFKLGDPTKWAKAPLQVRVILDNFRENKVQRITSAEIEALLTDLVKSGKLVTKQNPMTVFRYYMGDKNRGFEAFGVLSVA